MYFFQEDLLLISCFAVSCPCTDICATVFIFNSVNDFKEFASAIEAIKDKGVVVAVASPDDVEAANSKRPNFFQVRKAL